MHISQKSAEFKNNIDIIDKMNYYKLIKGGTGSTKIRHDNSSFF